MPRPWLLGNTADILGRENVISRMLGMFVIATCGTLGVIFIDSPFPESKIAEGMPGYSVFAFLAICADLLLVGVFVVLATAFNSPESSWAMVMVSVPAMGIINFISLYHLLDTLQILRSQVEGLRSPYAPCPPATSARDRGVATSAPGLATGTCTRSPTWSCSRTCWRPTSASAAPCSASLRPSRSQCAPFPSPAVAARDAATSAPGLLLQAFSELLKQTQYDRVQWLLKRRRLSFDFGTTWLQVTSLGYPRSTPSWSTPGVPVAGVPPEYPFIGASSPLDDPLSPSTDFVRRFP